MNHWEGIDEFVQVIKSGGFAAAGRSLGVSKAHVSKQIVRLEDRLGVRLLHRTTRRQALTEAGAQFYEHCNHWIAEIETLAASLVDVQSVPHGKLRISVAAAFAEDFVAPAVAEFAARYPGIEVELNFDQHIVDLVREGFDMAIRYGPLAESAFVARRIAPRRLHVCASVDYLARRGTPVRIDDLREHDCLIGTSDQWLFKGETGIRRVRVNGHWRSNNGRALLAATRRGLGLTQLPDFYVADDLKHGRLQSVLGGWEVDDVGVWIVYPSRRLLSLNVRLMIDHLAATLQPLRPE